MKKGKLKQIIKRTALLTNPLLIGAAAASAQSLKPVSEEKKFVEKSIKIGDNVISYNMSQNKHKKTIILQHGAFMNKLTMMKLAVLFRGYSVIVPDMAGHGDSVSPKPITDVATLADIEYEFIKKLKETGEILPDADITYAGWSLGGSIGLMMGLKEKIFERLILISSSPVWNTIPLIPEDKFYETFKNMFFSSESPDTSKTRQKWSYKNFDRMLCAVSVSENDITALRAFDISEKLPQIKLPTLIVCGSNDALCLPEEEIKLVSNIPVSKLIIYHGETHAMVIDHPGKVYGNIVDFINKKENV